MTAILVPMSVVPTIVVIEDDKDLSRYLEELLTSHRYLVYPVNQGVPAIKLVEQISPSLVLLDLTLPDIDGESVCTQLKKTFPSLPIIMLTAKDQGEQIVKGLNLGADDYITKPFNSDELLARVQARLRDNTKDPVIRIGDLEINTETFEVKRGEKNIPLTRTEYTLLHYLALNAGKVLTREMILSTVWAYTPDVESRVVDVYVGYLRQKIDKDFPQKLIVSVRGFGYMLRPPTP
ncbi:DNA-binding response regulator [Candidatus Cerribacteria bacterium 'Amazon FNV 2010 28 9']|uniref:DNA-binding response regulator n=1 Tax=Candidatus Cerribacteria bacterium 'Amazon FNV 2010 28 9' TaxID=2081795 RepID=A0A317JQ10_9BACT|nr:MAG: DNA-binding response regulator [Candidatus Cerribacteria bacterium 'Amazon FNV 2010 28 9']